MALYGNEDGEVEAYDRSLKQLQVGCEALLGKQSVPDAAGVHTHWQDPSHRQSAQPPPLRPLQRMTVWMESVSAVLSGGQSLILTAGMAVALLTTVNSSAGVTAGDLVRAWGCACLLAIRRVVGSGPWRACKRVMKRRPGRTDRSDAALPSPPTCPTHARSWCKACCSSSGRRSPTWAGSTVTSDSLSSTWCARQTRVSSIF